MSPLELDRFLTDNIPLAGAMAVKTVSCTPHKVVLEAPLDANINHRGTVFGGSAVTLCILAAWSLLYLRLSEADSGAFRLVIQRNEMDYDAPVTGRFSATARWPEDTDWEKFMAAFRSRGRARIGVPAILGGADGDAGRFVGQFVALSRAS